MRIVIVRISATTWRTEKFLGRSTNSRTATPMGYISGNTLFESNSLNIPTLNEMNDGFCIRGNNFMQVKLAARTL
jgi:hypothetical protein